MNQSYMPFKRLLTLLFIVLFSTALSSQVPDSIRVKYYLDTLSTIRDNAQKIPVLKEAIKEFHTRDDRTSLAGFYREMGLRYYYLQQLDSARISYHHAIDISTNLSDSTKLASAFITLAGIEASASKYVAAKEAAKNAIIIREMMGDSAKLASAYNTLGIIYQYQGNLDTAKQTFLIALDMSKRYKNLQNQSRVYTNLGVNAKGMGNYANAVQYFKKAEALEDSLLRGKLHRGQMFTYNGLAGTYKWLRLYDLSTKYAKKIQILSDSLGDPMAEMMFLNHTGGLLLEQGKIEEARKFYEGNEKYLNIVKSTNDSAIIYNNMGKFYAEADSFTLAEKYMLRAIDLHERSGEQTATASNYQLLGELYATYGKVDKATYYAERSGQFAKDAGDLRWSILQYGTIGIALFEAGETKKAIPQLLQAQRVADSLGIDRMRHELYEYLSKAYSDVGEHEKAMEYIIKQIEIEKKMDQQRFAVMLAETNASYGVSVLTEDLETSRLKRLHEQMEFRREKAKNARNVLMLRGGLGLTLITAFFLWRLSILRRKRNIELTNHNILLHDKNTQLELQAQLIKGQKELLEQNSLKLSDELEQIKNRLEQSDFVQSQYLQLNNKVNIKPASIYYIQSDRNYINVYCESHPNGIRDRQTLTSILSSLPSDYFVRVSKSSIVNMSQIEQVGTDNLLMKNKEWIKISPKFEGQFKQKQELFLVQ